MWSRRFVLPALAFSMMMLPARAEESANDVFSGAWNITFTPDDASASAGAKEFKDATLFRAQQLSAAAIAMYGFDTVPYNLTGDTSSVFTATMTSATQGTLQWVGRRSGGEVVGLLVWTKPDGAVHKYTFKGVPYVEN